MKISFVLAFLFFIYVNTNPIFACMCGHSSITEAYIQANSVVRATVIKIDALRDGEYSQHITLRVEKSYKGIKEKKVTLLQKSSTCDWWFKSEMVGKEFLFYLAKNENSFTVIACGRSAVITRAGDDLPWLEGLPNSLKRTRVSGTTKISADDFPAIGNVRLDIIGKNQTYKVTTDQNGLYEIWDVPPGNYSVIPTIPNDFILGWTTSIPTDWTYFWSSDQPDYESLKFTIKSRESGGVNFMFERKKDAK